MRRLLALLAVVGLPSASPAQEVAALYPDSAVFAFGVNVKGIATSPLGKKVIGTDKPFDATRKLLHVLLPQDFFSITDKSLQPLEAVANQLERITVAGSIEGGNLPPIAIFLEGDVDEDEYIKAAKGFAETEKKSFSTEKLDERKLLIYGEGMWRTFGLKVSKSLFVIVTDRELLNEVLDKHAGKRKPKVQPALAEWIKKAKPAETPMWLAVGELKILDGIKGGVATIAMKDNADFRIEVVCEKEQLAAMIKNLFGQLVDYFGQERTPQAKVWNAAGIKVSLDGTTVIATGSIPVKLLAEEYAKRK